MSGTVNGRCIFFDVDTNTDLAPEAAWKAANIPGAAVDVMTRLGLHGIAADEFRVFDLPDGTKLAQSAISTGTTCGWPYGGIVFVQSSGGDVTEVAFFVRSSRPTYVQLEHDCERSAGTSDVRLRFKQPWIEGLYSPRDALFVRCNGYPAVPCHGTPRLLRLVKGGLPDILREFGIVAIPASKVSSAYAALAEDGLPAQSAVDRVESGLLHTAPNASGR